MNPGHRPLLVIIPSRGRPDNAAALVAQIDATTPHKALDVIFGLDADDPKLDAYRAALEDPARDFVYAAVTERTNMNGTLNRIARVNASSHSPWRAIGFMGDDHWPSTPGWDQRIDVAIGATPGAVVYGNDLFQGEKLPTQVFMDKRIIHTLGWMAPPDQAHLFLDNFWLALGQGLHTLRYLPDVVIEHRHPHAGKASTDPGYTMAWARWNDDERAFGRYMRRDFATDLGRLRSTLGTVA